ncbi:hypothetical protein BC629DRAFT_1723055 [Irpex lacteus]|nr:hypothetical protein BC629DRAFT_1723055 [Irpex lacteus]
MIGATAGTAGLEALSFSVQTVALSLQATYTFCEAERNVNGEPAAYNSKLGGLVNQPSYTSYLGSNMKSSQRNYRMFGGSPCQNLLSQSGKRPVPVQNDDNEWLLGLLLQYRVTPAVNHDDETTTGSRD